MILRFLLALNPPPYDLMIRTEHVKKDLAYTETIRKYKDKSRAMVLKCLGLRSPLHS